MQRLSGAVDELSRVVERFDADASALDLTRQAALRDMEKAGGMAEARAESMRIVLRRHDKLSNDLSVLRFKPTLEMAAQFWRFSDAEVARKAWEDFKPAIPVTTHGIGFGAVGFLAGIGLIGAGRALLRTLPRRRRAAA